MDIQERQSVGKEHFTAPHADVRLCTSFPGGLLHRTVLAVRGVTNTSHMLPGRPHNTVPGLCRTGHQTPLRTFPTSASPVGLAQ